MAGNKLSAFNAFRVANLAIPEFTNSQQEAERWYNAGETIVCRTLLNAHSGRGIVLSRLDLARPVVRAPLFVKYKKKRREYRVHVFQGEVIDVCEKRRFRRERRPDAFDGYIRNYVNGWAFCRSNMWKPNDLDALAINACQCLQLDFGAVDIIWNERENKSYLLEVNTAPGLQGTTLKNYISAIYNWICK
jgi:hypothetical protein